MKTLEIGEAIGQIFRITFANFLPFMLLGGVCLSPYLGLTLWQSAFVVDPEAPVLPNPLEAVGVTLLGWFLYFLLLFVVNGAISYGVFQHLCGKKAALGDCVAVGFRRLFPVLGVAIVSGFVVFLGYIALIVPGIILYVMFYVAVPVAVVENAGVGTALRRSQELTANLRWRVFAVIFVLGAINGVITLPLTFSFAFAPLHVAAVLQWIGVVFGAVIQAVGMAVVYYQLRSAKELFNVDEIASVFA